MTDHKAIREASIIQKLIERSDRYITDAENRDDKIDALYYKAQRQAFIEADHFFVKLVDENERQRSWLKNAEAKENHYDELRRMFNDLENVSLDQAKEIERLKGQLETKLVFIDNGWEEERYALQESEMHLQEENACLKAENERLRGGMNDMFHNREKWRESHMEIEQENTQLRVALAEWRSDFQSLNDAYECLKVDKAESDKLFSQFLQKDEQQQKENDELLLEIERLKVDKAVAIEALRKAKDFLDLNSGMSPWSAQAKDVIVTTLEQLNNK